MKVARNFLSFFHRIFLSTFALAIRWLRGSMTCCYQNHLPNGGRGYYCVYVHVYACVLRRAYIINLIINFLKYFIYYDYNNSYFNIYKFINP